MITMKRKAKNPSHSERIEKQQMVVTFPTTVGEVPRNLNQPYTCDHRKLYLHLHLKRLQVLNCLVQHRSLISLKMQETQMMLRSSSSEEGEAVSSNKEYLVTMRNQFL